MNERFTFRALWPDDTINGWSPKTPEASPMFFPLSFNAARRFFSITFDHVFTHPKTSHEVLSVDKIVELLTSLKSIRMDFVAIKDLSPESKSVTVKFIVLEILKCVTSKDNHKIITFKVADQTASINCSIYGELGELLKPSDIVQMTKCFASVRKGRLLLSSGKSSKILRMVRWCGKFVIVQELIADFAGRVLYGLQWATEHERFTTASSCREIQERLS